jgi:hypothetical protein
VPPKKKNGPSSHRVEEDSRGTRAGEYGHSLRKGQKMEALSSTDNGVERKRWMGEKEGICSYMYYLT